MTHCRKCGHDVTSHNIADGRCIKIGCECPYFHFCKDQVERDSEPTPALADLLCGMAQILDVVKQEWGESWSEWDQSIRDGISAHQKQLLLAGAETAGDFEQQLDLIARETFDKVYSEDHADPEDALLFGIKWAMREICKWQARASQPPGKSS